MTTTLDALMREPVPADEHGIARACVVAERAGYRVAWALDGGRVKQPIGPLFARAVDASRASLALNARADL